MSFVWNIPSIPYSQQKLLCYGYINRNYKGYISADIMKLFTRFYSPTFYSLNDIKNAQHFRKYVSPIFSINQFKCYLEFWPNGSNQRNKGQSRLFFCFILLPPKIEEICTGFTLQINETETVFIKVRKFFNKVTKYCPWSANILAFEKLQNVNKLTINCTINTLKITQTHKFRNATTSTANIITSNVLNNLQTQMYTWEISSPQMINTIHNAPNVYGIASPIFELFGLKWYLTFCPNGSRITRKGKANVYLHLASVPIADVTIWIKQRLSFFNNVDESILKHCGNSDGWGMDSSVKTKELMNMNRFSFGVEITLIDVVAKNVLITDKFINGKNRKNIVINNIPCSYKWIIYTSKLDGNDLTSDIFVMFKFEWCLVMDITGKVTLNLLQKKWKGIDVLCVRCFVSVPELNMRYTLKGVFDKNNKVVDWGDERIDIDEFKKFGKCQLMLDMELVDVYCNEKDIRDTFLK
eukprot:326689_1